MTTASEIISDALGDILQLAAETPIAADDFQLAVRAMNRMVNSWGLALGYTNVSDPNDVLTVIAGAELAIQHNLAVNLAPSFDAIPTRELKQTAKKAYNDMLSQVVRVQPLSLPSTLAKGTGNNRGNWGNNNTFYPAQGAELTQEDDGSILLEQ